MALTAQQKRVARKIVRIGQRSGATHKEILSALETGRVESNFSNPNHGDGTSLGWRQETASSYPGVNRRDLPASIRRYYRETAAAGRGRGKTAGQLAQAVQRSAYPGRYDAAKPLARRLYRRYSGPGQGRGLGGPQRGSVSVSATGTPGTLTPAAPGGTELADYLRGQVASRPQVQASSPAELGFSARAALPFAGAHGPQLLSGGPVQSTSSVDDALAQIQQLQGSDVPSVQGGSINTATTVTRGAQGRGRRGPGGVPRGARHLKGVAHFDGKPVAAWIKPWLDYARRQGWKGSVSSGYRSVAEQRRIYNSGVRPAALPGRSNHNFTGFPGGAVDVTNAAQLARILRRAGAPLKWAGAKDPVHFSRPHNGSY